MPRKKRKKYMRAGKIPTAVDPSMSKHNLRRGVRAFDGRILGPAQAYSSVGSSILKKRKPRKKRK